MKKTPDHACNTTGGRNSFQAVKPECRSRKRILANRRNTTKAVPMRVLSRDLQLQVLSMLVEGCSMRSITRLTGVHRKTVTRLMLKVGDACREFLDRTFRNLRLDHVQCDEIWTFVRTKQAHLKGDDRDDPTLGDQYLFIALDEHTKLIPSFALGKRTAENTERFMDDLASRMVLPELHEADLRPMISTDAWNAYPNAVDGAFAGRVHYGQVIKDFDQGEQPGRYAPPKLCKMEKRTVFGKFNRVELCTSHVERSNLTIRTFMRRFTRLALGFSKKLENLAACIALYVAHYNFCRMHGTLTGTPAMAAKVTGHPWTMAELLEKIGI